jgi:hypothetical protein
LGHAKAADIEADGGSRTSTADWSECWKRGGADDEWNHGCAGWIAAGQKHASKGAKRKGAFAAKAADIEADGGRIIQEGCWRSYLVRRIIQESRWRRNSQG